MGNNYLFGNWEWGTSGRSSGNGRVMGLGKAYWGLCSMAWSAVMGDGEFQMTGIEMDGEQFHFWGPGMGDLG